ncbi:MAG TPA: permease-like cell division protein FtsX [Candidatus Paceibacterota bacterium]
MKKSKQGKEGGLSFDKIFKYGMIGLVRNGLVSVSSVVVMSITLVIIAASLIMSACLSFVSSTIESKVDVSVYMLPSTPQDVVTSLASQLEAVEGVAEVKVTTAADALAQFKELHADDELIMQSLKELNGNPLGPSITVKADSPSDYGTLVAYLSNDTSLEQSGADGYVEYINFNDNKSIIDNLIRLSNSLKTIGLVGIIVFTLLSAVISFTTIRLGIYSSRDEIGIMRLVGAENYIIRGPFMVEGVIIALSSTVVAVVIMGILTTAYATRLNTYFGGFNVSQYFTSNVFQFVGILLGVALVIGITSAYVATQKYLDK